MDCSKRIVRTQWLQKNSYVLNRFVQVVRNVAVRLECQTKLVRLESDRKSRTDYRFVGTESHEKCHARNAVRPKFYIQSPVAKMSKSGPELYLGFRHELLRTGSTADLYKWIRSLPIDTAATIEHALQLELGS